MDQMKLYLEYIKPDWAPPAYVFGPVWSFLYFLIFVSFSFVFYLYLKKKINFFVVLPFILNLFFNFIFTWIQFSLNNNLLALFDVILVWITLLWAMSAIYKHSRWVFYLQIPYLLWVSFATVLQASITYLNF